MSKYVIVDLEMCNVPRDKKTEQFPFRNELIEIGAVMLNDSLEIADSFMTYVAPEFGNIDAKIHKLTGISEKDIQNAPSTRDALEAFAEWIPDDAILVSWSETDEKQIRKELEGKNINIPQFDKYLDNWIDCQKTFSDKMNSSKVYRLSEALIIADIDYKDGAHDALIDAHNTALLFAKMEREPKLKLISCYLTEEDAETSMSNAFSGLLANYRFS